MKTFDITYCPNPKFPAFRFCKDNKPVFPTKVDKETEKEAREYFKTHYPQAKLLTINERI